MASAWPFPGPPPPNPSFTFTGTVRQELEAPEPFDWSNEEVFEPPPILDALFDLIKSAIPKSGPYIDSMWDRVAHEAKERLERELDEVYVDSLMLNATHRVLVKMLEQDQLRLQTELRTLTAEAAARAHDARVANGNEYYREIDAAAQKSVAQKQDEALRVGRQIDRLKTQEALRAKKFKERNQKIREWHHRQSALAIILDYGVKAVTPIYYLILLLFASLFYLFSIWRHGRKVHATSANIAQQVARTDALVLGTSELKEEISTLHRDLHIILPSLPCTSGGHDVVSRKAPPAVPIVDGNDVSDMGSEFRLAEHFDETSVSDPEREGGGTVGGAVSGDGETDDVAAMRLRLLTKAAEALRAEVGSGGGLLGGRSAGADMVVLGCALGSLCVSSITMLMLMSMRGVSGSGG